MGFGALDKRVSCAEKKQSTIYTSYDGFFGRKLPFGVAVITPALKLVVALIFQSR